MAFAGIGIDPMIRDMADGGDVGDVWRGWREE